MKRWTLRRKLVYAFLAVVIPTVTLMGGLSIVAVNTQFRTLTALTSRRQADLISRILGEHYARQGGWQGVDEVVAEIIEQQRLEVLGPLGLRVVPLRPVDYPAAGEWPPLVGARLVVLDITGLTLADTVGPAEAAVPVSHMAVEQPVVVDGAMVGTVVVDLGSPLMNVVLRRLVGVVVLIGLVSALGGVAVGAWLAGRLTAPLQALTHAARRLPTSGASPLPVVEGDEVGELTATFNGMAEQLVRQTALRRQSFTDIAHELRTPLSVIRLEVEALEDGMQTAEQAAAALRAEVDLLQRLADDLRTLSLAEAGQITLETASVGVEAFIRETVERWGRRAREAGLDLVAEIRCDAVVRVDPTRLDQILHNLLDNALRHTALGGRIVVGCDSGRGGSDGMGDGWVEVWVSDSGRGILPEDVPHVFDRFYRAQQRRGMESGGTGLGLAIARHLVEVQGGRIWVESRAVGGSLFRLTLPQAAKGQV